MNPGLFSQLSPKQQSYFCKVLQMGLLGLFANHLMPRRRDSNPRHMSRVAPDWDLWRTLYKLCYSAAVLNPELIQPHQKSHWAHIIWTMVLKKMLFWPFRTGPTMEARKKVQIKNKFSPGGEEATLWRFDGAQWLKRPTMAQRQLVNLTIRQHDNSSMWLLVNVVIHQCDNIATRQFGPSGNFKSPLKKEP